MGHRMRLNDLFETWGTEPLLISTATNGLRPEKDRLLAVAAQTVSDAPMETVFNKTTGEELLAAQKYHQITEDMMRDWGRDEKDFLQRVEELFRGKTLFSYSASFQYGFLSRYLEDPSLSIYDLSIVEQALRKGLRFDEEELLTPGKFYQACSAVFYPLPVNSICRNLGTTRQPSPGQLPLERSLDVLLMLYTAASSQDLQLLPS